MQDEITILVSQQSPVNIDQYAQVRMSLEVKEVLELSAINGGLGGLALTPRTLATPYTKDYDSIESPLTWVRSFDTSQWAFFIARIDSQQVGGAAVAFNTPGAIMLEDRGDLAVLWDIRVSTGMRGRGVGTALFRSAEEWATERKCRQLKVETQNINVPACRFYAKHGCVLGAIHRFAYPGFPDEAQLLWYKHLDRAVQ